MPESEAPQPTDEECSQLLADLAASRATPTQHQVIRNWFVSVRTTSSAGLVEALTPSAATKAAYIGEFHFLIDEQGEDAMCEVTRKVAVPWTTIKEIMAAIRERATPHAG